MALLMKLLLYIKPLSICSCVRKIFFNIVIEESLGLNLSNMRETTESVKKFCSIKPEMINYYFWFLLRLIDIQKLYTFIILNIS